MKEDVYLIVETRGKLRFMKNMLVLAPAASFYDNTLLASASLTMQQ